MFHQSILCSPLFPEQLLHIKKLDKEYVASSEQNMSKVEKSLSYGRQLMKLKLH